MRNTERPRNVDNVNIQVAIVINICKRRTGAHILREQGRAFWLRARVLEIDACLARHIGKGCGNLRHQRERKDEEQRYYF